MPVQHRRGSFSKASMAAMVAVLGQPVMDPPDEIRGNLVVEPTPPGKYDFVNWDDDIPNIWKIKMFETTNRLSSA